jgi:arylsulfatase A-like enzyme
LKSPRAVRAQEVETLLRPSLPGRRFWLLSTGALAAWLAVAYLLVPALIRSAYRGDSIGALNRIITGQGTHAVEFYLNQWSAVAQRLTVALLAAIVLFFFLVALNARERFAGWRARFAEREAISRASPPRLGPRDYVVLALWWGVLAGVWEAAYLAEKIARREWLPLGQAITPQSVWMAPLSYAIAFTLAGCLLYLVGRFRPTWLSMKWVVFALGIVSLYSMFRSTAARLETWGALPLAAGIAWTVARLAAAYPERFMRTVRVSATGLLLLIAGAAVAVNGHRSWSEHRALARLPDAGSHAPNVLLIILDTVRSKNLSLYGYDRPTTPVMERLAERGVVFDHAVATSPWTLPTHATVFTGRHNYQLGVDFKVRLDDTYPTLAERLRSHGYMTAGFVGNIYYCGYQFGLDRGFLHYEDRPITPVSILNSSWLVRHIIYRARGKAAERHRLLRKRAADINREFLRWLSGAPDSRPYFVFLNYFDAHSPYRPPDGFLTRFSDKPPRYWLEGEDYSETDIIELTAAYDGSLAYLDAKLGELMSELEARGELDNTLIILTSDHGEQFGEHGLMYHSNSLYMPLLHVPLMIVYPPAVPAGVRVADPVSLRDIAATVEDLLGLPGSFPGRSLARAWATEAGGDASAAESPLLLSETTKNPGIAGGPASFGDMQSLVQGRLHYIRRGDGHEELYDWIADTDEAVDLAATEEGRRRMSAFRTHLDSLLGDQLSE